jgi:hypothetical protein
MILRSQNWQEMRQIERLLLFAHFQFGGKAMMRKGAPLPLCLELSAFIAFGIRAENNP